MAKLTADYSSAFSRDLKSNAKRKNWNMEELEEVIDLIVENSKESTDILKTRHQMHNSTANGKVETSAMLPTLEIGW